MSAPELSALDVDVILRTHNRADMLPEAVASFFAADARGVNARLLVVDNASSDHTQSVLADLQARYGEALVPLYEARPGPQHALNAALGAVRGQIVACFDDDERIVPGWLQAIAREFADPATDYIAGPVLFPQGSSLPEWLPDGFNGALGFIDHGGQRRQFAPGFHGMLTQGNCALRAKIFEEFGPYPDCFNTAEDRWLNQWLTDQGKRGFYCPDFGVTHLLQPARVNRDYFRQWARREGHDLATCDTLLSRPNMLAQRWYWRKIAGCAARRLVGVGTSAERFRDELELRVAASYAATCLGRRATA